MSEIDSAIKLDAMRRLMNALETVDVVPVVRCKECKYFRQHSIDDIKRCGFKHDGMCRYWNSHSTNFEWFCVNGERKC